MKLTILIVICIVSPNLGEQEQDQEELDYYDDADIVFDAPVLRPSEFTIEELVSPNFHIDPDSTLTFNYDKVINGQSPEPIEKRKESVKHYLRVRKPTTKRVVYHIKPNKADEDNILSTPAYNIANVDKQMQKSENARPEIPDHYEEQTVTPVKSPPTPAEQNDNDYNGMNRIYETTQMTVTDLTVQSNEQPLITTDYSKNSENPIVVPEKQDIISDISPTTQVPRFRIRSNWKGWRNIQSRTTQSALETTAPTSTSKTKFAVSSNMRTEVRRKFESLSDQKRGQGRKWLQSTTTPITTTEGISSITYNTNKLPVPLMRFRLRKWPAISKLTTTTPPEPFTPLFVEQQSTKDGSLQEMAIEVIKSDISKKNKNGSLPKIPNESATAATLSFGTNILADNITIPQNKQRILRRKFQKNTSREKLYWPVRRNRIPSSSESTNRQPTDISKITPDNSPVTEIAEVITIEPTTLEAAQETTTTTETTTSEATTTLVTTVKASKKRRNFGRKRLRIRPTTSTQASTPEGNEVNISVNTDIQTVSDLDNTTTSPRMRNRNRFRKVKVKEPEEKEITSSTDEIIKSSSTIPSMTTRTQLSSSTESYVNDENSMDTAKNTESTLQEKPKSRFSKDNPPPPVPTLSPWFDGFGK